MFRIAPIVLLAASLCSLATAQAAEAVQKNAAKQQPAANGTVTIAPSVQPKPVDKPPPFAGLAYLELSANEVGLHAFVHGAEPGFVGVVGLSLTTDVTHSFAGLPPLLTHAVVMAYGFTSTQDLELKAPLFNSPAEAIMVYGQALIIDEHGLWVSGIVPLVIGEDDNGNGADKVPADRAAQTKAKAAKLVGMPAVN